MPKDRFASELRHAVLDLHKALMDAQRIRYEKLHGRISTSGEFLGLVLEHPQFAWLRALSSLIARLDEWIDDEKSEPEELTALVAALHTLVEPDSANAVFSAAYWEIVNDVPEATIAHVKLWRLLESAGPSGAQATG
ncbi:MAG TPA: hypothetical protein VH040_05920 [Usitatibacter sp.]|jgi:hypothetical protein|nr:hypothetical protein [Usitatibacter sp.]